MPQDEMSIAVNPADTDERLRRSERLPARLGVVRLLRVDGPWHTTGRTESRIAPDAGLVSDAGRRRRITSTEAATRSRSWTGTGPPTTGRSASSVRTTRAASSSTARRTAASPGAGRAFPTSPELCGGNGDPRQPGDGVVTFNPDDDGILNGSIPFDDKPYGTAGPRPDGVAAQCFTPTHTPTPCPAGHVGPDRVYITWTRFSDDASEIMMSFSDDRARSWSMARVINGSAPFCVGGARGCSDNQGSQPVVQPTNGHLYVTWENFDTPDENQYLLVSSVDGGATFAGPFFVTPVFDVNYPTSGANNRPDCQARGQGNGRSVLTNSCARVNARGALTVDKRGGAFANDLYLVIADNRNGTRVSSNTDVSFFKSTNGGTTWTGPTRVNDDPSTTPALRDCGRGGRPPCPTDVNTGNDQWFPWLDISWQGLAPRHVAGPPARHDLPDRRRRVADEQDQGGQLPRLVLGRSLSRHPDRPGRPVLRPPVRPSGRGDHHAAAGTGQSAGQLPRPGAVGLPVPELRHLRRSVQLGLLLPRRHLLRRLRERRHRHGQQRVGDVDRCPKRALLPHADRSQPGLRAVGRLG